jgi:hypothetical protein
MAPTYRCRYPTARFRLRSTRPQTAYSSEEKSHRTRLACGRANQLARYRSTRKSILAGLPSAFGYRNRFGYRVLIPICQELVAEDVPPTGDQHTGIVATLSCSHVDDV